MRITSPSVRSVALLVATALVLGSVPAAADQTVRCESRNKRYQYCRADVRGRRVYMVDELSHGRQCRQGYGWGNDWNGIWVDRGCRAVFEIRGGSHHGGGGGDKGAAIAGAAVGALILGAVIAGSAKDKGPQGPPPWAVGTFMGYNPTFDADVTMVVNSDGTVSGYSRAGELRGSWVGSNQIDTGQGILLSVTPEADGLRTTQVNVPANTVVYRRLR